MSSESLPVEANFDRHRPRCAPYAVAYMRDVPGRLTAQTKTLACATTTNDTYNLARRLAAVVVDGARLSTFTYDANGHRIHSTTTTYNAQDRLLR